jgi:hypothetical protein
MRPTRTSSSYAFSVSLNVRTPQPSENRRYAPKLTMAQKGSTGMISDWSLEGRGMRPRKAAR